MKYFWLSLVASMMMFISCKNEPDDKTSNTPQNAVTRHHKTMFVMKGNIKTLTCYEYIIMDGPATDTVVEYYKNGTLDSAHSLTNRCRGYFTNSNSRLVNEKIICSNGRVSTTNVDYLYLSSNIYVRTEMYQNDTISVDTVKTDKKGRMIYMSNHSKILQTSARAETHFANAKTFTYAHDTISIRNKDLLTGEQYNSTIILSDYDDKGNPRKLISVQDDDTFAITKYQYVYY